MICFCHLEIKGCESESGDSSLIFTDVLCGEVFRCHRGAWYIFLLSAGMLSYRVVKWKLVTWCIIVFFFCLLGIVPRVDVVYIED